MSEEPKIRLKPVVYTTHTFNRGAQNTAQQIFLLKALQVTQDPEKLRQMIHVKSVADVYRTLDKISMRKEYHEALTRAGISFDFIVDGIKKVAKSGYKDGDKLRAYQILLKSVGMETYDNEGGGSQGTWEEALLKSIEARKSAPQIGEAKEVTVYDVVVPEIPESVKKLKKEEEDLLSSVYDAPAKDKEK